jgi:glycosyltransferase involved in cell wall biosynthesis
MKILQVTNSFKYAWESGGVARAAYDTSRYLAQRGHEVTVFATEKGLPQDTGIKRNSPVWIDGIEAYYFSNLSQYLAERGIAIPYHSPSVVRKRLSEFDIIHLHEYARIIMPLIHHYAKKHSIPYILQAHGSLTRVMAKRRLTRLYSTLWGYRLLKDAAGVIALTGAEAEQYRGMGVAADKIQIIPNGISPAEFQNLPRRDEFRKKYGLDNGEKVVLYLGRIHRIKGLGLLVRAFAGLSEDNTRLVIAGPDNGYLATLKGLAAGLKISRRVLFPGPLYGRDKLAAYAASDLFVLPSLYETFPISVLEACACAVPVIITDRCSLADTVNGRAGYAVPHHEDALRDALSDMLKNDDTRARFGEGGRRLVGERFDCQRTVDRLEEVYQGVIRARANPERGHLTDSTHEVTRCES